MSTNFYYPGPKKKLAVLATAGDSNGIMHAIRRSIASTLQNRADFLSTIAAGSLSGLLADVFAYVPNRFKTLLMAQGAKGEQATTRELAQRVIKNQGVRGLVTGISPLMVLAVPSNAVFFSSVEFATKLINDPAVQQSSIPSSALQLLPGLMAQALAGLTGWTTTEVVKEAMQRETDRRPSLTRTVVDIYKTNGIPGFFRGYVAQFITYAPYNMLGLPLSNWILKTLFDGSDSDPAFLASFAFGYGLAGVITTPIDVVKTRVQLNAADSKLYPDKSITACTRRVYAESGVRGFFAGGGARAAWLAPRMAGAFWLFGKTKKHLMENKVFADDQDGFASKPWQ
jgi:hypothetical protein